MSRTYHHRRQPGWRRDERQANHEANAQRRRIQRQVALLEAQQQADQPDQDTEERAA